MRCLILACFSAVLFACSSSSTSGGGGAGGEAGAATTDGGGGAGGAANGGASQAGGGGSNENGGSGGAATTDTWDNFAQGFFKKYCVECHSPGDSTGDFNQLADVMKNAPTIRCGVAPVMESGCAVSPAPKQFPIGDGPKPTDTERTRIVNWIAAGLP